MKVWSKGKSGAASRIGAFSQHGLANLPGHNFVMIVIVVFLRDDNYKDS